MKKPVRYLSLLLLLGSLFACSPDLMLQKMIPDDVDRYARDYIEMIRTGDLENAILELETTVVNSRTMDQLENLRGFLNPGVVLSTELINGQYFYSKSIAFDGGEQTTYNRYVMEYYVQYSSSEINDTSYRKFQGFIPADERGVFHQVIQVIADKHGGDKHIFGFHVKAIPAHPKTLNAFTVLDRDPFNVLFLGFCVIVPLFILYSAYLCVRASIKHRWLWFVFILPGFGKAALNWSTGQFVLNLLSVQLLGASVMRFGLYGPWNVAVSFPLGAVLFHIKIARINKRLNQQSAMPDNGVENSSPDSLPSG